MKPLFSTLLCAAGLMVSQSASALGPVIYIADGDSTTLQAIDVSTGAINYSVTSSNLEYPIAVRDTIWLGHRDNTGLAREYAPATGVWTGNTAALTGVDPGQLLDGGGNATNNFSVDYSSRNVYIAQTDWSGLTALFTIPAADVNNGTTDGITYDTASDTLWFQSGNVVVQYDLAGNLLSSFNHVAGRGGIAYESTTDTLWLVPNSGSQPLLQYSKAGVLLDTVTTPTRAGNVWGAEFTTVPEPASAMLLVLGAALTARRRRH